MWFLVDKNGEAHRIAYGIKSSEDVDALCEIMSYPRSEYNICYFGF